MTFTLRTPEGVRTLTCPSGVSIWEALRPYPDLALDAPCGGRGVCQKCRIGVEEEGSVRMVQACQTPVREGMVLVPESRLPLEVAQTQPVWRAPDPDLSGYGIACDLGTTTLVCHLVDLTTGEILGTLGQANAQRTFGSDVIARIQASVEGHLGEMTRAIRSQLGDMIRTLCTRAGISPGDITAMTAAGNTTMGHLLCALPPDSLGTAPFTPVSLFGTSCDGKDLDLPISGQVYLTPGAAGYVGGDITADLLAVEADRAPKPVLLIDVGTNGEMTLGQGAHILCCSTAAGPAFEGAQITCGMTAAPGAVSRVELGPQGMEIQVIGGGEARGICGSGLIDAVAALLEAGLLDETGRMTDPEELSPDSPWRDWIRRAEGETALCLTDRVSVTQGDIRALQLGKAAIAAGVQVLISCSGLKYEDIDALLLAGGFGATLRPQSAAKIGMIPEELLGVTRAVGNTAAQGAYLALVSKSCRDRLGTIRDHMTYLELSGRSDFTEAYLDQMYFP